MDNTRMLLVVAVIVISLIPGGQPDDINHLADHQKAVAIVEKAMRALAPGNSPRIRSLQVDWEGLKYMDGQSMEFKKPLQPLPVSAKLVIDFETDRLMAESADRYFGGYLFHFRQVYADSSAFSFEVPKLRFSGISELSLSSKAAVKQTQLRNVPYFLVSTALEKKQTLRYRGEVNDGNTVLQVVGFAYNANLFVDVYFNNETGLPARYSYFTDHPIHGDQLITYTFEDYRNADGIMFPLVRKLFAGETLLRADTVQTIKVNGEIDAAAFSRPGGYGKGAVMEKKLKEIGKNIYLFEGLNGYNPLVLDFKDSLVVVEAVNGSEELIETIRARFNKPVRSVVLSHYHEDHTGGLAAFINNGIPVMVAEPDTAYVQHVSKASHSILAGYNVVKAPVIKALRCDTVLKDDNVDMRILHIGKNSHTGSMLVFYFPDKKILYQADMLISTDQGAVCNPVIAVNRELYAFIKRNKLAVDTIYGVHWKSIAFKELEKAVLQGQGH